MRTAAIHYKPYTPAQYLYNEILGQGHASHNLDKFIELVYATLCAWNMNQRQAKLSSYSKFRQSIRQYYSRISALSNIQLQTASDEDFENVMSELERLFLRLDLVAQNKPRIVTFSKCLHYFLPNLIIPIDRSYTIKYYKGHKGVPATINKQFKLFKEIQLDGRKFSRTISLTPFLDSRRQKTIPKIIDNLIIDFQ